MTFIRPPHFKPLKIKAFFTTKIIVHDNKHVDKVLAKELNISKDNIYLPIQKHTNKIYILESELKPVTADAVITAERNILIGILVADCVPILLCDRDKRIIAAVHAGWKGTAKEILKSTVKRMIERFNCSYEDILVAIGPSIRQCSYEVGEDVKVKVQIATGDGNYYSKQGEKYFLDLSSANRIQALSMGILQKNIWQSEECTFCNPEKFYSYRYAKGSAGRQGGFIGMW